MVSADFSAMKQGRDKKNNQGEIYEQEGIHQDVRVGSAGARGFGVGIRTE
jgi:hypothetical protein